MADQSVGGNCARSPVSESCPSAHRLVRDNCARSLGGARGCPSAIHLVSVDCARPTGRWVGIVLHLR